MREYVKPGKPTLTDLPCWYDLPMQDSRIYRLLIWLALCLPVALARAQAPTISFTAEEQAYIARAESIKMCVDPDWMPFERINEQGQHEGISADLVQLVAQRVGLRIELLQLKTWDEMLAASKAGHCQIMSFLNRTPARDQWLIFTDPIFYDPNILITREEHAYVGDLRGIQNRSLPCHEAPVSKNACVGITRTCRSSSPATNRKPSPRCLTARQT